MQSMDDILGQIKLPEKVYKLCLRPDLQSEWEKAEAEVEAAYRESIDSLAGGRASGRTAAKRVQQLEAEMEQHSVSLRLRALTHKAWSDLIAAHPPREGIDDGSYNSETFGVGLLAAGAVDPSMTVEQAGQLVDNLTMGQWNDLQAVLFNLNVAGVSVPKSRRASELLRSSTKK